MTTRYSPPPIIKSIERLLVDTERAVATFARRHRYDLGGNIRRQTMRLFTLASRACRDRAQAAQHVEALAEAIDELRMLWQIAQGIPATESFSQFEHHVRQIDDIGRQCGGWKRSLSPQAQNARDTVHAQRGQKLGTRTASIEANT